MRLFCVLGLWMFLSELKTSSTTEIHGHVGKSVSILCSHTLASNNKKYFCRDPCKDEKDTSVRSDQSPKGRYTLKDFGNGTFNVTITDLQLSDSGIYWCAVDRTVLDTYEKVRLTVIKDDLEELILPRRKETQTLPSTTAEIHPTTHKGSFSSSSATTENTLRSTVSVPHTSLYKFGIPLIALPIVLTVLLTIHQYRKRVKTSEPASSDSRSIECTEEDTQNSTEMKSKHKTKAKEKQTNSIYQNLDLNTGQSNAVYGNLNVESIQVK